MPDQFFQDTKDMKALKKFYKKAPNAFQRVSAGTLNGLAFEERTNFQRSIKLNMIVRSPGLLKKLTRVKTASKSTPINQQQAETFTTTMARHEGWEAAASGGQTKATQFTDDGRVGNKQTGKSRKEARQGQAFTEPQDVGFSGRMSKKKVIQYLQRISRSPKRRRRSFYLPVWFKRMQPGVYRFVGGVVRRPKQLYGKGSRFARTKSGALFAATLTGARFRRLAGHQTTFAVKDYGWQEEATKETVLKNNVKRLWLNNFNHEIKKIKIK
jgi:hypothetical protein